MKRFFIEVYTNWCGEQQEYVAYANNEGELEDIASELAYENFNNYPGTGFDGILEELYPDIEIGEYTEEMTDHANEVEGEYYGYSIDLWDESRPEEEWGQYELIYDGRKMKKYKIFAGLSGGFGGAQYQCIDESENEDSASEQAHMMACDIYESHKGYHGLRSYGDCIEEAKKEFGDINDDNRDEFEDQVEQIYNEYRESWLDYWVEEIE